MKVRIGTWDVPDNVRRAIRARRGETGLATRKEIIQDVESVMGTVWDDYVSEVESREGEEG